MVASILKISSIFCPKEGYTPLISKHGSSTPPVNRSVIYSYIFSARNV